MSGSCFAGAPVIERRVACVGGLHPPYEIFGIPGYACYETGLRLLEAGVAALGVLVEGISVIVRTDALDARYPGGRQAFRLASPRTYCCDDEIARVGFMAPDDVKRFVQILDRKGLFVRRRLLARKGLVFRWGRSAVDVAIVDQRQGATPACGWLGFGRMAVPGGTISVCWLRSRATTMDILVPDKWQFEGSLSQTVESVPPGVPGKTLTLLRHENGLDVYWDRKTRQEVFVGRNMRNDLP